MSTPAEPPTKASATALAEAVRRAAARRSGGDPTTAVLEMATTSGPCDAASITLLGRDRALTTVASSNDLVRQADALQYELDEGPCLDAVWTDGVFVVPDLIADGRWPRWAPRAAELGVTAILAVHLFTDSALGALNLYSLQPRSYEHSDVEAARIIAAHASVVLAYSRTEQNLWQAIDSRNLIGQAQGILMERFGLTSDSAFSVLRRYSQHHNRKLAVVSEELVSTGRLPGLGNRGDDAEDDRGDARNGAASDERTGSAG